MTTPSKIHIIGICGKATAGIAKMFLDLGWEVSGSDKAYYPPVSEYLEVISHTSHKPYGAYGLRLTTGYSPNNISPDTTLAVIGGGALIHDKNNPEVARARELGIRTISQAEVMAEYLEKKNSIVVCGTYGKTTVAAMMTWILECSAKRPSYMIGGLPNNLPDSLRHTKSDFSVIEGDEHPTKGYSDHPKFYYYHPKQIILTSAEWDHMEIYPTENAYVKVFVDLAKRLPPAGTLVYSLDGKNTQKVAAQTPAKTVSYARSHDLADWHAAEIKYYSDGTSFKAVRKADRHEIPVRLRVLGDINIENAMGALALGVELGLGEIDIIKALGSFTGVERRSQIRHNAKDMIIIEDHAPSPVKAQKTIESLHKHFPAGKYRLRVIFDPHASDIQNRAALPWFKDTFKDASEVVLRKLPVKKSITKDTRVHGKDILAMIKNTQPNAQYLPLDEQIIAYLRDTATSHDVIVFMSTGNWGGMIEKVINSLK